VRKPAHQSPQVQVAVRFHRIRSGAGQGVLGLVQHDPDGQERYVEPPRSMGDAGTFHVHGNGLRARSDGLLVSGGGDYIAGAVERSVVARRHAGQPVQYGSSPCLVCFERGFVFCRDDLRRHHHAARWQAMSQCTAKPHGDETRKAAILPPHCLGGNVAGRAPHAGLHQHEPVAIGAKALARSRKLLLERRYEPDRACCWEYRHGVEQVTRKRPAVKRELGSEPYIPH
jgi:hypothetical protein